MMRHILFLNHPQITGFVGVRSCKTENLEKYGISDERNFGFFWNFPLCPELQDRIRIFGTDFVSRFLK
jgi:hypothetical protein